MNYDVPSDATFAAVLIFALFAAILAVVADKAHFFSRAVRWIQKDPVVRTALVVLLFAIGPTNIVSVFDCLIALRPNRNEDCACCPLV